MIYIIIQRLIRVFLQRLHNIFTAASLTRPTLRSQAAWTQARVGYLTSSANEFEKPSTMGEQLPKSNTPSVGSSYLLLNVLTHLWQISPVQTLGSTYRIA